MTDRPLWHNANYRKLFTASAFTNLGDGVSSLALPWLATLLTRDPLLIGAVAMAGRLPWLLLSLPVGVWTDRADRRRLILRADLLRAALSLGLVLLALSPPHAALIWPLALLAFALGCAEVLRDTAAQTLLPALVAPGQLERANGQIWSIEQVMGQFAGPPLAGALIGLGVALPFGLDAASFALSAALIASLALPATPPGSTGRFWPMFRAGLNWLLGHRTILRLALMLGVMNGLYAATATVLVLYAQEVLGLSATGYGLLLMCGAAGGVLGGLGGPGLAAKLGPQRSLTLSLTLMALGYLLFLLPASAPLIGLALGIQAFAGLLWNIVTVSYRQRAIPPLLLGRVNAIYRFLGTGTMALGALAGGALVAALDPALPRGTALHAPFALATLGHVALLVAALRSRLQLDP